MVRKRPIYLHILPQDSWFFGCTPDIDNHLPVQKNCSILGIKKIRIEGPYSADQWVRPAAIINIFIKNIVDNIVNNMLACLVPMISLEEVALHMNDKGKNRKNEHVKIDRKEQAYRAIKNRIFSGFYMPRQHLVELSLSNDLGVNRMVIRDVLKRLAIEGLVVMESYKGCTVKGISIDEVYQTYQVEAVLEGFAVFLGKATG